MSNNNHYRLPDTEDEVKMVEEPIALRTPSTVDIASLRHDSISVLVNALPREALSACVEMALKDHEYGNCIPHASLMESIKKQIGW